MLAAALIVASGCASPRGDIHDRQRAYQGACRAAERRSEEKAIAECRRCLESLPEDGTCSVILYGARKRASQKHYTQGVMLHGQGRDREAQEEFDAAAELDPDKIGSEPFANGK
jgi:tetratricopeptide (TPR) repeat protein